jgi:hypothetical protein
MARWIETLAQYNFEIHLRAGIKHNNADALSRVNYTTKLCIHQQNEEFDASCESCKNIVYQWKDFKPQFSQYLRTAGLRLAAASLSDL